MTTCPKCHYTRRPEDTSPDYECPKCGVVYAKFSADADLKDRVLRARSTGNWMGIPREHVPREMLGQVIARIPASTTPFIPGRDILEAVDVVSAECAYGMNVFKDFFTGVTDKVGGRSGTTESTLRGARQAVMSELRAEAFACGADGLIGVSLSYSEFSGGGKSMLFVVATGTAVKLGQASLTTR